MYAILFVTPKLKMLVVITAAAAVLQLPFLELAKYAYVQSKARGLNSTWYQRDG